MLNPDEEIESRANRASYFTDFEERCARCGVMYCYHMADPIREWYGAVPLLCPDGLGVFVLPEKV